MYYFCGGDSIPDLGHQKLLMAIFEKVIPMHSTKTVLNNPI